VETDRSHERSLRVTPTSRQNCIRLPMRDERPAPWARVRHVTVETDRSHERSLRPWLLAALLTPAVIMLLNTNNSSLAQTRSALSRGSLAQTRAALSREQHGSASKVEEIHSAEAKGSVQAVQARNQAIAMHDIVAYSASSKVATGKMVAHVQAAAKHAAATHMLEASGPEDSALKQEAERLVVGSKYKNPDKILIKMFMESKCPACRQFSTTYVKQILETPGLRDVVDFEYVAW